MTKGRRLSLLMCCCFWLLSSFSLHAQRPSDHARLLMASRRIDPKVRGFATGCLKSKLLPKPVELYSQHSWFVESNLPEHIRSWRGADDDGTAQVWESANKPRAISLWVHDDEFDRHTLACLDGQGTVTHAINEYLPGMSEPNLHWIYIHSIAAIADGKTSERSHYTDWAGRPIPVPRLNSEDRDFIAGERKYLRWNDFDFATAFDRNPR